MITVVKPAPSYNQKPKNPSFTPVAPSATAVSTTTTTPTAPTSPKIPSISPYAPVSTQPFGQQQPTPKEKTGGALGAVARFTGVEKLGLGVAKVINNASGLSQEVLDVSQHLDPRVQEQVNKTLSDPSVPLENKKRLIAIINSRMEEGLRSFEDISTGGLTNKEVLGSAAQTALNIGLAGTLNAGASSFNLAKTAAPTAIRAGAGAAVGRIATKAGIGFGGGFALGTAQGFSDDKSLGESIKEGLVTGTISGILGGSIQGVSEAVRAMTAPQVVKTIYDSGIGVGKAARKAGQSPSPELIKKGVVGTAQSIYDKAQTQIDEIDPKIIKLLQNSKKTVTADSVFQSVADGINSSAGNAGEDVFTSREIKLIIQENIPHVRTLMNKPTLTPLEANQLRRIMDRTLGDPAFAASKLPFSKDVLFDGANSLRGLVQELEPATKNLFKDYTTYVRAIKALNSEIGNPHVLTHLLSLMSAFGAGVPGIAGGVAIEGLQSTIGKTTLAVGLNAGRKALEATDKSIAAELIKKFGMLGFQNLIK